MTPELWQRLKLLYHAALDMPDSARIQFITEACGNDRELLRELTALLKASEGQSGSDDTTPFASLKHALATETESFAVGELLLGRFRIVRRLGSGGLGEVYEALDLELGRIAVKTIRADIANNPDVLARFKREVQLARKISGQNICRIYELFVLADNPKLAQRAFLTMEYLDGTTLADRIHELGPLPWRDAKAIAFDICDGLRMIHEAGIIHRDLKSRNIMLASRNGSTRAILMDFGLARELSGPASKTASDFTNPGAVIGTPNYMAPEQFEGKEVSPATDVYALGIIFYELVTGEHPFAAATPMAAAVQRGRRLKPASSTQRGLPREWDDIIAKCLEFKAEDRYQSAAEVKRELDLLRWGGITRISIHVSSLLRKIGRVSPIRLCLSIVLAGILISAAVFAIMALLPAHPAVYIGIN